jgi:hypothetical protein
VESKFLEPLRPQKVDFSEQYRSAMNMKAEPMWRHLYQSLLDDPKRFKHLDAAQLVKHYLGFRHSFRGHKGLITIVYLYWESKNADSIPEFTEHRREISTLAAEVANSEVRFISHSYPKLWQTWLAESLWDGIGVHISELRKRYAFDI